MKTQSVFDQLIQRGISCIQEGNLDAAVHSFSQALQQSSDSVCAYANRATAHYLQGSYENALDDLSRALELAPDLFSLYVNRGMTYRKLGEGDRAAADFGQALRLNPQQFSDCLDRLVLMPSEYSTSSRDSPVQKSSADSPPMIEKQKSPVVYNLTGIARPEFHKNIFKLFESVMQFCVSLEIELNDMLHRKAQQEILQFTLRLYDQAIAKEPSNPLLYWDRSCLLSDTQKYEAAIGDLSTAIQYAPTNSYLWLNRAIIYYKVLDLAHALTDITRSIELNPASADAYVDRAVILIGLQRFNEARADLDLAIQIAPQNSILRELRNSITH
jgi:tetratricopeptide (TPR) repeat protein